MLQWLGQFCYSVSSILAIVTRSVLDCVSHFWDFGTRYSDSTIFSTVTQSFFDFVSHFWDFGHALQWLVHFATMTRSFWDFVSHFLWFRQLFWDFVMSYSDSAMLLQWCHTQFCKQNQVLIVCMSRINCSTHTDKKCSQITKCHK
jgi:hypothetical protein